MRAIAPPDVARQTLDEQKMLAHELLVLPESLETSGLAKTHERSYIETIRAYVILADDTWIAVAEERLEQSGAEQTHRQSAINIARQVKRMQQREPDWPPTIHSFRCPASVPFSGGGGCGCSAKDCATGNRI